MSQPNFFIVGAPKCGTTAWANYLSKHPAVYVPSEKEPHFFNTDHRDFRWAKTEEDYLKYFSSYTNEKIVVDASVQYLYSEEAALNIANFNPNARILVMLRRPSTFIRSYHNQLLLNFDETIEDLRTAWDLSGQRSETAMPPENREPSFLNYKKVGLFAEQVSRYLDRFDRSRVMVTFMEDWSNDPRAFYVALMDFLNIDDDGRTNFPKIHTAKHVMSRSLHRFTQRPPNALKAAARIVRKTPGLRNFKPAHLLRRMNKRDGYSTATNDSDLAKEIDAFFAEDQARLRQVLCQTT